MERSEAITPTGVVTHNLVTYVLRRGESTTVVSATLCPDGSIVTTLSGGRTIDETSASSGTMLDGPGVI